jgi:hypothetical protein
MIRSHEGGTKACPLVCLFVCVIQEVRCKYASAKSVNGAVGHVMTELLLVPGVLSRV